VKPALLREGGFSHVYDGRVDTSPHAIAVARLNGAAQRLAGWTPPTGQARAAALEELHQLGGDDTDAYAETAGIMLGAHPAGDATHGLFTNAAALVLEAGGLTADDERVRHWIAVGAERRERGREAQRAGDHWGAPG
jgi:hypothetical protein